MYAAAMDFMPDGENYAWMLSDICAIYPFPVKGQQGFFNVDDTLIHRLPEDVSPEEKKAFLEQYINPLIYHPARK